MTKNPTHPLSTLNIEDVLCNQATSRYIKEGIGLIRRIGPIGLMRLGW